MFKKLFIVTTVVGLLVAIFSPAPAQASHGSMHWKPGTVVCVDLPSAKATVNWQIKTQLARWNNLPGGPVLVARSYCKNWTNSIKIRVKWTYDNFQARSWTYPRKDNSGLIAHSDIELNPYGLWAFAPYLRACLRAWAMSHEAGHASGLHHWMNSYSGNVMSYWGWSSNCGRPQWADRNQYATVN